MKNSYSFRSLVLFPVILLSAGLLGLGTAIGAVSVSLTGAVNGEIFTNGATISLTATAAGLLTGNNYSLSIFDGLTLLFVRPLFSTNSYLMPFAWTEPPLGNHALRAELVDEGAFPETTNKTAVINISVIGNGLGFYGRSNLVTIPSTPVENLNTIVGAGLIISNRSSSASNPLRVRFFLTQTYFYDINTNSLPNPNPVFSESVVGPIFTSPSLVSNATVTFTLSTNSGVTCPISTGAFSPEALQNHIFAVLEEQVGSKWAQVDRTKIFSSVAVKQFPANDGVVGVEPLPNTNTFAYLTNLVIAGPTNILEGTVTNLLAIAALSDGATGSVNAAWSASPISIGATGTITAPLVNMDTPVTVTASFVRKTTRTTMRTVIIKNLVAPPVITTQPTNTFVAIGSNAIFTVSATGDPTLVYQWRRNGTNLANATNTAVVITNAQIFTNGTFTVVITNSALAITSNPALLTVVARPGFASLQRLANQTFQFTLSGTTGSVCRVEHSTNLSNWLLLSNVTMLSSPITMMDPGASNQPRRFYRARVGP